MRVAIIHPWLPQYRKQFFEDLVSIGESRGFRIDVFHGAPPPEWGERGDSVHSSVVRPMRTRFIRVGERSLVLKSLRDFRRMGPYDLVVVEQGVRNLETVQLLLERQPLAFWGHGKTYTKRVSRLQEWLKILLTRRGRWFFAYTQGGADQVIAHRFPPERVTVVQNSIDTTSMHRDLSSVSALDVEQFKERYALRSKTALFIGGLDGSKRLNFLLKSADLAYSRDNDFRLVVVGNGSDRDIVEAASRTRSWLSYCGSLFGKEKATALRACEVISMPGRVGLVAVDSFAAERPIVTTNWEWHAPEYEYLESGKNSIVSADDEVSYANALVRILNDPDSLANLRQECRADSSVYTLNSMVENFLEGLELFRQAQ